MMLVLKSKEELSMRALDLVERICDPEWRKRFFGQMPAYQEQTLT